MLVREKRAEIGRRPGRLHEAESEFFFGLHEIKSEPEKTMHEVTSELARNKVGIRQVRLHETKSDTGF